MQRFYKPLHFPATLCLIGASAATWLLMMTPLADVVLRNLLIAQTAWLDRSAKRAMVAIGHADFFAFWLVSSGV